MNKYRGFTLIELMVTVAVLAILVAIAAPSFTRFTDNVRLDTAASELKEDLIFARQTARGNNRPVVVCAGTATACPAVTWNTGWIVFMPAVPATPAIPAGLPIAILRQHDAVPASLAVATDTGATTITYTPTGFPAVGDAPVNWAFNCPSGTTRAAVSVNQVGKPEFAITASGGC